MNLTKALDTVLDRALIGYGNVGYNVRRRAWEPLPRLDGKVVVVTGAKAGLGRATVVGLARLGATVHLAVRGREAGEAVREEILRERARRRSRGRRARRQPAGGRARLRGGVGGPAARGRPQRGRDAAASAARPSEGHELTLATHVLGPHELTKRLPGGPRASGSPRAACTPQKLNVDDLEYLKSEYKPVTAYARTKRMQVVLAEEWAKRLADARRARRAPGLGRHARASPTGCRGSRS